MRGPRLVASHRAKREAAVGSGQPNGQAAGGGQLGGGKEGSPQWNGPMSSGTTGTSGQQQPTCWSRIRRVGKAYLSFR